MGPAATASRCLQDRGSGENYSLGKCDRLGAPDPGCPYEHAQHQRSAGKAGACRRGDDDSQRDAERGSQPGIETPPQSQALVHPPTYIYGEAEFAKGRYRLETVWHFDRGRAELFSLVLWGGGEQIQVPPPVIRMPRRLMDPPLKRRPMTA